MNNEILKSELEKYLKLVFKVHGEHAISAILFTIASLHQDRITKSTGCFPILFLHGSGSTGKDELSNIMNAFTPNSHTINLEGFAVGIAFRQMTLFKNTVFRLGEYENGYKRTDGRLKAFYDRRGILRGTIDPEKPIKEIEIENSFVITSNEFPKNESLLTRLISCEMTKNVFTSQEYADFDDLKEWTKKGLFSYSKFLSSFGSEFENNFESFYYEWNKYLRNTHSTGNARIISNYAFLTATFEIMRANIKFPFTQSQMMSHLVKQLVLHNKKI